MTEAEMFARLAESDRNVTVVEEMVRPIVGSGSGRCEICLGLPPVTQIVFKYDDGARSIFDVCRDCADSELAGDGDE